MVDRTCTCSSLSGGNSPSGSILAFSPTPPHSDSLISFVLADSLSSLCETFHPFFSSFFLSELRSTGKAEKNKQLPTHSRPCRPLRGPSLAAVSSYSSVTHDLLSTATAGFTASPCYNTPQQDGTQGVAAAAHPSQSSGSGNSWLVGQTIDKCSRKLCRQGMKLTFLNCSSSSIGQMIVPALCCCEHVASRMK